MNEEWIIVPNWDRFQHYKDRTPPWIKVYTSLPHHDEFRHSSAADRGHLVTIWVEYALSLGQLSTRSIAEALGKSFRTAALERLNDAGFIQLSASKPPPIRLTAASSEKRRERKKKGGDDTVLANSPVFVAPKSDNGAGEFVCPMPMCGIVKRTQPLLDEHLENVHGQVTT